MRLIEGRIATDLTNNLKVLRKIVEERSRTRIAAEISARAAAPVVGKEGDGISDDRCIETESVDDAAAYALNDNSVDASTGTPDTRTMLATVVNSIKLAKLSDKLDSVEVKIDKIMRHLNIL